MKFRLLSTFVSSLGLASGLFSQPITVDQDRTLGYNEDLVAAGLDGVEASSNIVLNSNAIAIFATDGDSKIVLKPGFTVKANDVAQFLASSLESGGTAGSFTLNQLMSMMLGDNDGDGIPDWWELANGLDPNNPNDASVTVNGQTYLQMFQDYISGKGDLGPDHRIIVDTSGTPHLVVMESLTVE